MRIDLHTHTYFSDGSFSPADVVNTAISRKVKYLAITDHDTIIGIKEAIAAAKSKNILVIPGIEITCNVNCSNKEVHILGLYFDFNNKRIKDFSDRVVKEKIEKTNKRISLINKSLNTNITFEEVKSKTWGAPSSAHIWMVLVDKGLANNIKEARNLFLAHAKINEDASKSRIMANDAIKMIHGAGGIAVLAHLGAYKKENKFVTFNEQEQLIKELITYGLDGIEIYIPDATPDDIAFGERIAQEYSLKLSCGSDFHDEKFIPQNKIGCIDIDKNKINVLKD